MSLIINFKIYLYTPKVSYPFILSHITYCQNACLFYMKNFKSKYRVYIFKNLINTIHYARGQIHRHVTENKSNRADRYLSLSLL